MHPPLTPEAQATLNLLPMDGRAVTSTYIAGVLSIPASTAQARLTKLRDYGLATNDKPGGRYWHRVPEPLPIPEPTAKHPSLEGAVLMDILNTLKRIEDLMRQAWS